MISVVIVFIFDWALRYSHAIELTLFLWHMPADATETVAEHRARLQPSSSLHAPVAAFFMFNCSGTDALPRRDVGSGKPCAVIEASYYIVYCHWPPLRIRTRVADFKIISAKRWLLLGPLHFHCTLVAVQKRAVQIKWAMQKVQLMDLSLSRVREYDSISSKFEP